MAKFNVPRLPTFSSPP